MKPSSSSAYFIKSIIHAAIYTATIYSLSVIILSFVFTTISPNDIYSISMAITSVAAALIVYNTGKPIMYNITRHTIVRILLSRAHIVVTDDDLV